MYDAGDIKWDYDTPPDWLRLFTAETDRPGRWRVYRDTGGSRALVQREAIRIKMHYYRTEFWLIRKGEDFPTRRDSVRIWTGALNSTTKARLIRYLAQHDHNDSCGDGNLAS